MAKFIITLEDADPSNPNGKVSVHIAQVMQSNVYAQLPTNAFRLARYVEVKILEFMQTTDQATREDAMNHDAEAARCWH